VTLALLAPRVVIDEGPDGRKVLRSTEPLGTYARCLGDLLVEWATRAPARPFLGEREGDGFRTLTYAETLRAVRGVAQALLDRGASPSRPVMILGDNGIDHALVALAAMHVGVPAAPVSPAYSLQSRSFAKLVHVGKTLGPSVVVVPDKAALGPALEALRVAGIEAPVMDGRDVSEASGTTPTEAVDRAFAAIGPDTVAKVLFTSGSTGEEGRPKGIANTHRMLTSNQQAIAQMWPFLEERPPVVLDWLPWSHTFGANHNFNMVLRNGGTLYVDGGKPTPALVAKTVENLRLVSPTLMFNVPRGFDALLPFLEADAELRRRVFAELDVVFYAAAALPPSTWARLSAVATAAARAPFMTSAWGLTETAPLVTGVHFPIDRAGVIGLPAPGCELALVPVPGGGDGRLEMRVRGPNVTPGVWRAGGEIDPLPTDEHGFFATGDAGKLADDGPGVVFDGRIGENFKLTSGTWVAVGALRVAVIAACAPLVADAVVAGEGREDVALLLFAAPGATP
jgi:feruloyl-CoA synthase